MKQKINRLNSNVDRFENLLKNFSIRKRESIQKSMIRPLYQEALKSLFFVIVIIVDTLIPLEIFQNLSNIIGILFTLVIFSIFLYVEIWIYNKLWGKSGHWSLEKYKKH